MAANMPVAVPMTLLLSNVEPLDFEIVQGGFNRGGEVGCGGRHRTGQGR